jgi:hypothetical protein
MRNIPCGPSTCQVKKTKIWQQLTSISVNAGLQKDKTAENKTIEGQI